MWHHLQITLIGAAILAATGGAIAAVIGVFMLIPEHPRALGVVVFTLLSWAIGLIVTDNIN